MTNQETFKIEGTVVRILQAQSGVRGGNKWTLNKFVLKTPEGADYYISKFGPFDASYIGKDIRFEATKFNDKNYTIVGDVEEAGEVVQAHTSQVASAPVEQNSINTTRRRGRPSKAVVKEAVTPVTPLIQNETNVHPVSGREAFRIEAEASVITNITSATNVLNQLGLKGSVNDLVAVADLIGRTQTAIFMDAQKDSRMARFSR